MGLYSVANKISWRTVQLLVNLFFLVPAPILSRLWEERGRQATEEVLTEFTRMFFLMLIPSVVGLAIVAAPLMRFLADKAYFGGYPAIWLVACASMALGLSDLGSIGCMVANHTLLDCQESNYSRCNQYDPESHPDPDIRLHGRSVEHAPFILASGWSSSDIFRTLHDLALAAHDTLAGITSLRSHGRFGPLAASRLAFGYDHLAGSQLAAVSHGGCADLRFGIVGTGGDLAETAP